MVIQTIILFLVYLVQFSDGNRGRTLRLYWENGYSGSQVHAIEAIYNAKADLKKEIEILESARTVPDQTKVVLLCLQKVNDSFELFFAAISEIQGSVVVNLHSLGGFVEVQDMSKNKISVKIAAENYTRHAKAFQEFWQAGSILISAESNNTSQIQLFGRELSTLGTQKGYFDGYSLHSFWKVEPGQIFVLYELLGSAIVVTVAFQNDSPQFKTSKRTPVFQAYETIASDLDSELAFLPGWSWDKQLVEKFKGQVPSATEVTGKFYAVYKDENSAGTIHVTHDTYPPKACFVAWVDMGGFSHKYQVQKTGQAESIGEAALSYHKYRQGNKSCGSAPPEISTTEWRSPADTNFENWYRILQQSELWKWNGWTGSYTVHDVWVDPARNKVLLIVVSCFEYLNRGEPCDICESLVVALSKFAPDGKYQFTWMGSRGSRYKDEVREAISESQKGAELYASSILAFKETWVDPPQPQSSAADFNILKEWNLSITKKIRLLQNTKRNQFWYEAFTTSHTSERKQMSGLKKSSMFYVFEELGKALESPHIFCNTEKIQPDAKMKAAAYNAGIIKGTADITSAVLLDDNKAIVVFTIAPTNNVGIPHNILIPVIRAEIAEYKCISPITTVANMRLGIFEQWKDYVPLMTIDPLAFMPCAVHIPMQFTNDQKTLILDSATWNMPNFQGEIITRHTSKVAGLLQDFPTATAHICSLGIDGPSFFVAWNAGAEGSLNKLKFVGGLGNAVEARAAYVQYLLSITPFQETTFNGIGWYGALKIDFIEKLTNIIVLAKSKHKHLEWEFQQTPLDSWRIGINPTTAAQVGNHVTTYCLYGKVDGGYVSAILKMQYLHDTECGKLVLFGNLRQTALPAENDIYEYAAIQHEI